MAVGSDDRRRDGSAEAVEAAPEARAGRRPRGLSEGSAADHQSRGSDPAVSNNVEKLRKQLGLSRYALAKKVGVDVQTISRIETGFIRKPRRLTREAIAEVLRTPVEKVFPDA